MASIQDAKAQLDAAIAQEAAQNAAAFQTLDDAAVANTAATQKVVDDINKLLQEVKAGGQIDVSTELAAIAQNAANAQKAATVIKDAVDSATAAETAADQAVNPSGPSDEQAPAGPQS